MRLGSSFTPVSPIFHKVRSDNDSCPTAASAIRVMNSEGTSIYLKFNRFNDLVLSKQMRNRLDCFS